MAKSGRSQSGFQNTHRCCDPLRNEPNQSKASAGNIMIENLALNAGRTVNIPLCQGSCR